MLSGGLCSCVFLEIAVQLVGFIQVFLSGAVNSFSKEVGGWLCIFFFLWEKRLGFGLHWFSDSKVITKPNWTHQNKALPGLYGIWTCARVLNSVTCHHRLFVKYSVSTNLHFIELVYLLKGRHTMCSALENLYLYVNKNNLFLLRGSFSKTTTFRWFTCNIDYTNLDESDETFFFHWSILRPRMSDLSVFSSSMWSCPPPPPAPPHHLMSVYWVPALHMPLLNGMEYELRIVYSTYNVHVLCALRCQVMKGSITKDFKFLVQ